MNLPHHTPVEFEMPTLPGHKHWHLARRTALIALEVTLAIALSLGIALAVHHAARTPVCTEAPKK